MDSKSSVMARLCLAVLCLIASSPCAAAPPGDELPSVFTGSARNKLLLISFDGFRWDYDRDVETPNLDKMAKDGVKAAYVTPPFLTITSPSHFTMLSGKSNSLVLYILNGGQSAKPFQLPQSLVCKCIITDVMHTFCILTDWRDTLSTVEQLLNYVKDSLHKKGRFISRIVGTGPHP